MSETYSWIRVFLEVGADESGCFFAGDLLADGEAVVAEAVKDAEIEDFRAPSLLGRHLVDRDVPDLGRRRGVDVLVGLEGGGEAGIAGHVGDDAQLDLRVVGRQ